MTEPEITLSGALRAEAKSKQPHLIAIAAMARNRVIGNNGKLPWPKIPEDMAHFRETTLGHPVIMGRKTWSEFKKPLSGRFNIVLSKSMLNGCQDWNDGPAVVALDGVEWALDCSTQFHCPPAYVIGGAQTYAALMPWTKEILLTVLDFEVEGDTYFPEISESEFELVSTKPLSERVKVQRWIRSAQSPPPPSE